MKTITQREFGNDFAAVMAAVETPATGVTDGCCVPSVKFEGSGFRWSEAR